MKNEATTKKHAVVKKWTEKPMNEKVNTKKAKTLNLL